MRTILVGSFLQVVNDATPTPEGNANTFSEKSEKSSQLLQIPRKGGGFGVASPALLKPEAPARGVPSLAPGAPAVKKATRLHSRCAGRVLGIEGIDCPHSVKESRMDNSERRG